MKTILLLSTADNPHTIKWATGLSKYYKIIIFSLKKPEKDTIYRAYSNIRIYSLDVDNEIINNRNNILSKIIYFKAIPLIKTLIEKYKPEIVHAHYATSYGLLAILSGVDELYLSLWGSDVYLFPKKSILHRFLFKFILRKSKYIFSTSEIMKVEALKYCDTDINVIPFGIDVNKFFNNNFFNESNQLTIGTIKGLEKVYGIDILIKAFKIILDRKKEQYNLKLLIVGGGSEEINLKKLVSSLELDNFIKFTGKIDYERIVEYHNQIDIFVALSLSESFGVAVIEASSCEKPVVVSNADGLKEVVENDVTGLIVKKNNPEHAAEAILKLVHNNELRKKLGNAGRDLVLKKYDWSMNLKEMIKYYEKN